MPSSSVLQSDRLDVFALTTGTTSGTAPSEDFTLETRVEHMPTIWVTHHVPSLRFAEVDLYYKHGAYGSEEFKTLREGLQEFLEQYLGESDSHEDGIRRQQLEALPDEELLTEILKLGVERIKNQVGHGLVAVVKGPQSGTESNSRVYLDMYYKHGEWNVSQGWSSYIEEALEELENQMRKDGKLDDWEDMSEEEQEDLALEKCQDNVNNQYGWGTVMVVPGRLVARAQ